MVDGKVTNEVEITWDDEAWAPVIKNLKDHSTKYNLYFVEGEADFNSSILACNESGNAAQCFLDNASLNTKELVLDETVDNNLRYIEADPNNYVTFNNESWRIIGVMNNIDDGTGVQESRLKIIPDSSIGSYSWSSVSIGSGLIDPYWGISTLQDTLNTGTYWNSLSSEAQDMIGMAVWHLGGTNISSSSLMTNTFYEMERGSIVYENNPSTWTGNVALPYPSDYVYATEGGNNIDRATCLGMLQEDWNLEENVDCRSNDWLFTESRYWTLFYNVQGMPFAVENSGYVRSMHGISSTNVYPTVYLSSDVKIISGNGTMENPYGLSVN